jgi:hypothetical protein
MQQKIEYQSSVCLPYIGPASHKIERILKNEAGIKVYHSSENKLFRALCTHFFINFTVSYYIKRNTYSYD